MNNNLKISNYSKLINFKLVSKHYKSKIPSSNNILIKSNSNSHKPVNAYAQVMNAKNKSICLKTNISIKAENCQKSKYN